MNMSEEFKVSVGVELDDASFNNLKQQINGKKVGDIKVNLDISDAESKISSLKKQIQSLGNEKVKINIDTSTSGGGKSGVGNAAADLDLTYRKLKTIYKNIEAINIKLPTLDVTKNAAQIKTLESQLNSLTSAYYRCVEKIKNAGDINSGKWKSIQQQIGSASIKLQQLQSKMADTKRNAFEKIKFDIDTGNVDKNLADVRSKLTNLEDANKDTEKSVQDLVLAYKELNAAVNSGDFDKTIAAHEKYVKSLKNAQNQLKVNQALQKDWASETDIAAATSKMDLWLQKNSRASADYGAKIKNLQSQLQSCDKVTLNNVMKQFQQLTREAELAGKTGMTFKDNIKKKFSEYAYYFSVPTVAIEITQALRNMAQQVIEVDTAMTQLKRVTDLSANQYAGLYDELTVSAREYGTTLSDIINATADWSRAGFDPNTAKGLAEVTTMYQHIADVDYETGVENLLTAYKGFESELKGVFGNDTVAAVSYIGDILNELDKQYCP